MRQAGKLRGMKWAGFVCVVLTGMALAQQPARTTVSATVYRADGTAASGTVLISWPALPRRMRSPWQGER